MSFDWNRDLFKTLKVPIESNLDIKELQRLVELTIVNAKKTTKYIKKDNFSPSIFGGQGCCPRFHWYRFCGAENEENPDAISTYNMEFGTSYGDVLEERLLAAGVATDTQTWIKNQDPPISGKIDFIGEINGEKYVVDIKTTDSDSFEKIRETGKAKDPNIVQLLIYMKLLKLKSGALLYVNRNSGKMICVPVNISPTHVAYVAYLFDWLTEVKKFADEQGAPPSRAYTKSTWQCKGCPVRKVCYEDENVKKIGPGKLEINIEKWAQDSDL